MTSILINLWQLWQNIVTQVFRKLSLYPVWNTVYVWKKKHLFQFQIPGKVRRIWKTKTHWLSLEEVEIKDRPFKTWSWTQIYIVYGVTNIEQSCAWFDCIYHFTYILHMHNFHMNQWIKLTVYTFTKTQTLDDRSSYYSKQC